VVSYLRLRADSGNKLTDAGLDSCTLLYGQYQYYQGALFAQYEHLLFAKAMAEQKIYFTYFLTKDVLPPST
jgi:hypothetical protein